jgi:hypothetical protein
MDKFPKIVSTELKYYVYIYSNPITDEIFYVGKGKGDRVLKKTWLCPNCHMKTNCCDGAPCEIPDAKLGNS